MSVRRLPHKHSPEEGDGGEQWVIHLPVQPMPWPDDRLAAELDDEHDDDEREDGGEA
jgi:hypothetical protein